MKVFNIEADDRIEKIMIDFVGDMPLLKFCFITDDFADRFASKAYAYQAGQDPQEGNDRKHFTIAHEEDSAIVISGNLLEAHNMFLARKAYSVPVLKALNDKEVKDLIDKTGRFKFPSTEAESMANSTLASHAALFQQPSAIKNHSLSPESLRKLQELRQYIDAKLRTFPDSDQEKAIEILKDDLSKPSYTSLIKSPS